MASESRPLLLSGGFVFDSESRTFSGPRDVLCEGGRITRIAAGIEAPGAERLDCAGKFVLPGLIDCHVHLTSSGEGNELNTAASDPTAVRAWRAAGYARTTLHSGVTTVRDLGAAERLKSLVPAGMKAQIDLSITDDFPLAQAIVIISAVPENSPE